MTVFAHFGHWTTSLAFFAPVVILPLGLFLTARAGQRSSADSACSDERRSP
jgi:hypothetical protein